MSGAIRRASGWNNRPQLITQKVEKPDQLARPCCLRIDGSKAMTRPTQAHASRIARPYDRLPAG
ncbi:hypothetical protein D3C76_1764070 [compost metagenome]